MVAEAGSPKSVKLSSRLRSLLRSEESNVLVGPVTYPKAHKNIQKPSKHVPASPNDPKIPYFVLFRNLCPSQWSPSACTSAGQISLRDIEKRRISAGHKTYWESRAKQWIVWIPQAGSGWQALIALPCFKHVERERDGERARERERERGSLKTQQHPLNLHQSRSVLQAS